MEVTRSGPWGLTGVCVIGVVISCIWKRHFYTNTKSVALVRCVGLVLLFIVTEIMR